MTWTASGKQEAVLGDHPRVFEERLPEGFKGGSCCDSDHLETGLNGDPSFNTVDDTKKAVEKHDQNFQHCFDLIIVDDQTLRPQGATALG